MSSFEILNTLPFIGVLVVEKRKIIFANREMKDILGWPPEDLKGKSLSILFSEEAYALFLEALTRIEEGKAIKTRVDAICLRRNKENIYCFFSLATILGGRVIITVQDAANGGLTTDSLTGLYNRRTFLALASHETETAKRFGHELFVVCADVDGLKEVNDKLGHAAGDELLRSVAEILRATFRKSDIVARVGGDEFFVLASIEPRTEGKMIERLKAQTRQKSQELLAKRGYPISLSVGIARYNSEQSLQDATEAADALMYQQKKAKKKK